MKLGSLIGYHILELVEKKSLQIFSPWLNCHNILERLRHWWLILFSSTVPSSFLFLSLRRACLLYVYPFIWYEVHSTSFPSVFICVYKLVNLFNSSLLLPFFDTITFAMNPILSSVLRGQVYDLDDVLKWLWKE